MLHQVWGQRVKQDSNPRSTYPLHVSCLTPSLPHLYLRMTDWTSSSEMHLTLIDPKMITMSLNSSCTHKRNFSPPQEDGPSYGAGSKGTGMLWSIREHRFWTSLLSLNLGLVWLWMSYLASPSLGLPRLVNRDNDCSYLTMWLWELLPIKCL